MLGPWTFCGDDILLEIEGRQEQGVGMLVYCEQATRITSWFIPTILYVGLQPIQGNFQGHRAQ